MCFYVTLSIKYYKLLCSTRGTTAKWDGSLFSAIINANGVFNSEWYELKLFKWALMFCGCRLTFYVHVSFYSRSTMFSFPSAPSPQHTQLHLGSLTATHIISAWHCPLSLVFFFFLFWMLHWHFFSETGRFKKLHKNKTLLFFLLLLLHTQLSCLVLCVEKFLFLILQPVWEESKHMWKPVEWHPTYLGELKSFTWEALSCGEFCVNHVTVLHALEGRDAESRAGRPQWLMSLIFLGQIEG